MRYPPRPPLSPTSYPPRLSIRISLLNVSLLSSLTTGRRTLLKIVVKTGAGTGFFENLEIQPHYGQNLNIFQNLQC